MKLKQAVVGEQVVAEFQLPRRPSFHRGISARASHRPQVFSEPWCEEVVKVAFRQRQHSPRFQSLLDVLIISFVEDENLETTSLKFCRVLKSFLT